MKLIRNGKIYLGKKSFCEALLLEKGRIVKTGSNKELLAEFPGAEKIDAEGALILPAFHDSHVHLQSTGRRAGGIETAGSKSIEDVIRRGRELISRLKPPVGTHIIGDGVNPDLFTEGEKRDLRREDLDKISNEHPIILRRHCGHIIYCNSLAMKIAGVSESAPDIEGGTTDKDASGRPTGVFRENAMDPLYETVPAPSKETIKSNILIAMKEAHSLGICSVASNNSSGSDFDDFVEAYRSINDEGRKAGTPALRVNMQCSIGGSEETLDAYIKRGVYLKPLWSDPEWGCFLKMGSIKIFIDGSLGGQTAWMRKPYRDKPETLGIPVMSRETLKRLVIKSAGKGLGSGGMQVLVHAIGDAGMDAVISAFEQVTSPGSNPLRHGIIHCQITTPDLLERMAKNNILALVQPVFLSDDIHILESRVGPELAKTSYAWGSMHKLGISVSYGTDAPISRLDPLPNIQWAVQRSGGRSPAYNPPEKVDIFTAVDAYTAGSAFSTFDENSLGRIAPGYLADLVFLDRDIFSINPDEIHKAKVLRTMSAGETVYKS